MPNSFMRHQNLNKFSKVFLYAAYIKTLTETNSRDWIQTLVALAGVWIQEVWSTLEGHRTI